MRLKVPSHQRTHFNKSQADVSVSIRRGGKVRLNIDLIYISLCLIDTSSLEVFWCKLGPERSLRKDRPCCHVKWVLCCSGGYYACLTGSEKAASEGRSYVTERSAELSDPHQPTTLLSRWLAGLPRGSGPTVQVRCATNKTTFCPLLSNADWRIDPWLLYII